MIVIAGTSKLQTSGKPLEEKAEMVQNQTITAQVTEETVQAIERDPDNNTYPFNRMSADWGSDDVEGFTLYQIPAGYKINWGKLPEVAQVYAFCICKQYGIDIDVVIAVIEVESGYRWDADSGEGKGYMQIVPAFHEDRMNRLNVTDIMDPYQNIRTGIDYLSELLGKYDGDYAKALTAYRWGPTGAYADYFSAGVYSCAYSEKVLGVVDRIRAEKQEVQGK